MSHLTIRTTSDDESNLLFLHNAWGVGRSEIGRRALQLAAASIKNVPCKSKIDLLKESGLLGALDTKGALRKNYKTIIREKTLKKYAAKKHHR